MDVASRWVWRPENDDILGDATRTHGSNPARSSQRRGIRFPAPRFSPYRVSRPFTPIRPFAVSPIRPFALSAILEVPVVLYVALADDFASAVNEIELTEHFVLVLQVDCPIPASGGSRIGTPG